MALPDLQVSDPSTLSREAKKSNEGLFSSRPGHDYDEDKIAIYLTEEGLGELLGGITSASEPPWLVVGGSHIPVGTLGEAIAWPAHGIRAQVSGGFGIVHRQLRQDQLRQDQLRRDQLRRDQLRRDQLRQDQLRQEVDELLETAGVENWDGEGALAVKQETAEIAKQLISYFPDDIEEPDVEATPRGEVDFDWILSKEAMLTVSVGPSGDITFVGSFRSVDFNGTEPWANKLPCFIHCGFEQLRSLSDI